MSIYSPLNIYSYLNKAVMIPDVQYESFLLVTENLSLTYALTKTPFTAFHGMEWNGMIENII